MPPGPPGRPPGPGLADHLKRIVGAGGETVSPREALDLDTAGVPAGAVRSMLVWRRSALLLILPVLVVSVVLGIIGTAQIDTEVMTGFGALVTWLSVLAGIAMPVAALYTVIRWTDVGRATRVLFGAWLAATLAGILPAIFPLSWIYDFHGMASEVVREQGGSMTGSAGTRIDPQLVAEIENELAAVMGIFASLTYMVVLLPVIIGLVGGSLRGARRAKSLFPSATLPGWFTVVVAPFYSIVLLTIFAVLSAMYGGGLLTGGILLLALAPLVFVLNRRRYIDPLSHQEAATELPRAALPALALSGLGMLLVFIHLATATPMGMDLVGSVGAMDGMDNGDAPDAWLSYGQVVRMVFDVAGRFFLTAIVLGFFFARLAFHDWRSFSSMSPQVRGEHDREMANLQVFTRTDTPAPPTGGAPAGPAAETQRFAGPSTPPGPANPPGPAVPPDPGGFGGPTGSGGQAGPGDAGYGGPFPNPGPQPGPY